MDTQAITLILLTLSRNVFSFTCQSGASNAIRVHAYTF